MARRLTLLVALAAAAALGVPSLATASGYILIDASDATAGKTVSVKATVYSYPAGTHSCRLILRPPVGRAISGPARSASGERAVLRWRMKIPLTAPAGGWDALVRCQGIGTRRSYVSITAARSRVTTFDPQFVALSGYSTPYYAWYAQIENRFSYEIHDIDYRVVMRDANGRIVKTITGSDETSLTAGEGGLIAGRVDIEAEAPASITVTASGDISRRLMRPNRLEDLRLVTSVPFEGAAPEISALAEAVNESARLVSADRFYVAVFDPAGRLLNADSDYYPGDIPVGQSRGIEVKLGDDGATSSPRVEAFWAATPKG